MNKLNAAVIGVGHLGSRHLKVLTELKNKVQTVGICDNNPQRLKQMSEEYKLPSFDDYRSLLGKVNAVNICAPTLAHFEIAKFFLKNGVHTFIEKPISHTLDQADELIALARQKNLKLQVGHVERFNSAFLAIKHFAKEPLFVECHRLNHFPNRSLDIGVVMDLMIHDIDIILGLNNCAVKNFHAVGVNVLTSMEDIASARIIMENGCVCNLTASRISDEVMRKIRIFLPDSYISLDYVKQEAYIYKKRQTLISKHALPIEKEEPLKKEIESFIDCILTNTPPVVSGIEARAALDLALNICQQISENQQAIKA